MNNKKGWMRILEATIAVLIVSGTLLVVYSKQIDRTVSPAEYFEDMQGQILADVSTNSSLRLNVLNADNDSSSDSNFSTLNNFVAGKISEGFGYSLQICNLSSFYDYCKMDYPTFVATIDKNIFTEEIIVSAELGDGDSATYEPKKVKLYVWEGDVETPECVDEDGCYREGTEFYCDTDLNAVVKITCADSNSDGCLERGNDETESCETSEICENGECVYNKAELEVSYEELRRDEGTNPGCGDDETWFYYDMKIYETSGIADVTLKSRRRCYYWIDDDYESSCDTLRVEMPSSFGGNVVQAGSSIDGDDRWFCVNTGYDYDVVETFYSDTLGNDELISYTIDVFV